MTQSKEISCNHLSRHTYHHSHYIANTCNNHRLEGCPVGRHVDRMADSLEEELAQGDMLDDNQPYLKFRQIVVSSKSI